MNNNDIELIYATKYGNLETVKQLVKTGSNVHVRFPVRMVSTILCSTDRLSPSINEMTKNKTGSSLLHMAVQTHREDICQFLVNAGIDLDAKDENGCTALHWSIEDEYYNKNIFNTLIDAGACVNQQDEEGWTILHIAAEFGLLDACTTLLGAGSDISIQNEDGETALDVCKPSSCCEYDDCLYPDTHEDVRNLLTQATNPVHA